MKQLRLFVFLVAILAVLLLSNNAYAQNVQNFNIESFNADYYLDKDQENASTLKVEEILVAVFPNYDQNHGILRAIPERYQNHSLHLGNISVTDESGRQYDYTTYSQNDNKVLKIGNANSYVHGRTIYKISYQYKDVISFYDKYDEFFWDINGDQWPQSFGTVTTNIHIPENLSKSLKDRELCKTGAFGSNSQNCSITRVSANGELVINSKADSLGPYQTLSVVLGFNDGTFELSKDTQQELFREKVELIAAIVLAVILPAAAFIFMFRRWRQFGNDPKGRGVIIPEYEPPKGFNPLTSDFLLKQILRNNAVTATLIDLAVKGYITIIEIPKKGFFGKKDYKLVLNKIPDDSITEETASVLNILFGDTLPKGAEVQISEFSKNTSKQSKMYKQMKKLEDLLADNLSKTGFFVKNPKKVKNGYILWALALFFTIFLVVFISNLIQFLALWGLALGIAAAAFIIFAFAFIMPARTESGVLAHDALLGLKDYIKLAEADRLKFLQSPEGAEKIQDKDAFDPKTNESKIKLFEKLLPYAILFGLEKDWAKQFNDIYVNPPDWYQGGNWTAFNAGYLAGSLSDFNSAAATNFASPSSSSGSGFSGGGAGGGGGGGGGGGW